jgi:uncharacterized protein YceK
MKLLMLIIFIALSGCVSIDEQAEREGAKAGAPRWKIDAVKHGCNTGEHDGGNIYAKFQKDYEQYKNNPDYAMIYEDAYRSCRARYEAAIRR